MQIRISNSDGVPIYRQIVNQVKYLVAAGRLAAGDQLPPVRTLAEQLVVNPNTVSRAYRELERDGLVESGPRRGTFVTFDPPRLVAKERRSRLKPHLDGLVAEAIILGFSSDELRAMLDEALRSGAPQESDGGEENA